MTLVLHEKCKARLTEVLTSALAELIVENGKFLARRGAVRALAPAEKVLPLKGDPRIQLGRFVDHDTPLTEFMLDTLSDELSKLPLTDSDSQPLTEIAGYADCQVVARRLVECLISLPNNYTLSFPLPSGLSSILGSDFEVELSPKVRIVREGEGLSARYPPTKVDGLGPGALSMGLLGALGTGFYRSVTWAKDGLYLQVDVDGHIGPYGGSNPHLEAVRVLRAFCGLGLALGLFEINSVYLSQTPPSDIRVHRQEPDGSFLPVGVIGLDDAVSRTVKRIALSTYVSSLDSERKQVAVGAAVFVLMRVVLLGGKKADQIFLAAQWFFDGHNQGPDQLLQFIQTMVVLEILLGDKASSDQTGLNVLLRNRCAYLIGNSQEDRAELLEWFQKIYDVRSKIVHSGKHWLSAAEFELFARLRWICRRVIRKEIDLLRANEGS